MLSYKLDFNLAPSPSAGVSIVKTDATMGRNQSKAINRKTNTASSHMLSFESLDDVWVVCPARTPGTHQDPDLGFHPRCTDAYCGYRVNTGSLPRASCSLFKPYWPSSQRKTGFIAQSASNCKAVQDVFGRLTTCK